MPGIHHVIARTIKDIFCRYKTMKGFLVDRKAGWDTHGLGNQNWYFDVAVIEVIDRQVINEGLFIGRDPLDAVLRIDDATQACTVRDTGVSITRKSDKKKLELDSSGIKTNHALAVVSQVKADIEMAWVLFRL